MKTERIKAQVFSFIFSNHSILVRVAMNREPIPATLDTHTHTNLQRQLAAKTADQICPAVMITKQLLVELRDEAFRRKKAEGLKKICNVLKLPQRTVKSITTYSHYIRCKKYGLTQTIPRSDHPSELGTWAERTRTILRRLQSLLAKME